MDRKGRGKKAERKGEEKNKKWGEERSGEKK